ncbi:hypothetical protein VTH82DRAFT_1952 [Thermothelomyces myriococcoides]
MAPAGSGSNTSGSLLNRNMLRPLKSQQPSLPPSRKTETIRNFSANNPQPDVTMNDDGFAETNDPQESETQDEEMDDEDSEFAGIMTEESENDGIETEDSEDVGSTAAPSTTGSSLSSVKSATEDLASKSLDAQSQWPYSPSRRRIRQLARCTGLDDETKQGMLPHPTARDVIVNALSSVEFLREVGKYPVNPDAIGIDWAGRLFMAESSNRGPNNYRADFCDMVATLRRHARHSEIEDQMKACLRAINECCRPDKYGMLHLTNELESLVRDVLQKKAFGVVELRKVLTECKKVVASLEETLFLFAAVRQDLLETGSTSLKRWNQLREHRWLCRHQSLLLGGTTQEDMGSLRELLTQISLHYCGPLGYIQELMRHLNAAIDDAEL